MTRQRRKKGEETWQSDKATIPPPTKANKNNYKEWSIFEFAGKFLKKLVLSLCVLYCLILLLACTSLTLRRQCVYMNYLVNPFINYTNPAAYGLSSTRNFYIEGEDGKLGVWHISPEDSTSIDDGKPLVLYMHGNAYSRAAKHRVALYKMLSSIGYHVIAYDYRGFGDSDGTPTEEGLVDDGLAVFQWILANTNRSPVFLWGHSLGSAVAVKLSKMLTETGALCSGLILEAPFNNMRDGSLYHPLSLPYRFLPFFQDALQEINDMFKSDELISSVKYNILILHDHTDRIIAFKLGKKLYEAAVNNKKENQLIEFADFHGFGHNKLFASPKLPGILRKFMSLETKKDENL